MALVPQGISLYTSPLTMQHLRSILAELNRILSELIGTTASKQATSDAAQAIGQPLYMKSTGNTGLAQNDDPAHTVVIGLASSASGAGATGTYLTAGKLTVSDWTAIIGSASLTPGTVYYLSATAGQMTATAPTSSGTVVRLGVALTTKVFDIRIEPGILL